METKYPKGIFISKAREGAPEFVRAAISIKAVDAVEWINSVVNEAGYVNIDVLNGEKGLYLKHNDWKPEKKSEGAGYPTETINPEDVPF